MNALHSHQYIADKDKKQKLLEVMKMTEEKMRKEEELLRQQVTKHGYTRDASQIVLVMFGKIGQGKSTLCNRICDDTSKKGNQGPFGVSSKKTEAGTTEVISHIKTTDKGDEKESILIVDTPGWDDLEEKDREFGEYFCHHILYMYTIYNFT